MIKIKRRTRHESRFHPKMGALTTPVTKISKTVLGIPVHTVHEYRTTYHGKVKDCETCELNKV
ncbi:MAG: hypothetical protein ACR2MS_10065 [Weeksellaceae bacterium]